MLKKKITLLTSNFLVKYEYIRKQAIKAKNDLSELEHNQKDEMHQAMYSIEKLRQEVEEIRSKLEKANERNEALNYSLKDRERQLENWKQTYAKRTGGDNRKIITDNLYSSLQSHTSATIWQPQMKNQTMREDTQNLNIHRSRRESNDFRDFVSNKYDESTTRNDFYEKAGTLLSNNGNGNFSIPKNTKHFNYSRLGSSSSNSGSQRTISSFLKRNELNSLEQPHSELHHQYNHPQNQQRRSKTSSSLRDLFNRPPSRRSSCPPEQKIRPSSFFMKTSEPMQYGSNQS